MDREREELIARYFPDWSKWETDWKEWKAQSQQAGHTLVLIPARAGSTRLSDKNVREICGKPLLVYTAEIATALEGVDRVVISTDSEKYARIAERYGVEAPFLRPKALASTKAAYSMAYFHLLCFMARQKYPIKTVITLLPTNPFRNRSRIQDMVFRTKKSGLCYTVFRPSSVFWKDAVSDGQDKAIFKPLGTFKGQHFIQNDISHMELVFITNPIELVDIDTEEDFLLAAKIIENNLYDFGLPS